MNDATITRNLRRCYTIAYSFRLLYFYCERGLLSSSAHDCLTLMEDIDSEDDVSLYHGLRIRRVTVAVSNVVCQRCNYNVKFETLLYNTREFGFAHGETCRTRNASRSFEKHFFLHFFLKMLENLQNCFKSNVFNANGHPERDFLVANCFLRKTKTFSFVLFGYRVYSISYIVYSKSHLLLYTSNT